MNSRLLITITLLLILAGTASASPADGYNWQATGEDTDLSANVAWLQGIHCEETYCYVSDRTTAQIHNYSISGSTLVYEDSWVPTPTGNFPVGISCNDNNCFLIKQFPLGIYVYSLDWVYQNITWPQEATNNYDLFCDNEYCYVAGSPGGTSSIDAYNISDGGAYVASKSFEVNSQALGVSCSGDYCYVAGIGQTKEYLNGIETGKYFSAPSDQFSIISAQAGGKMFVAYYDANGPVVEAREYEFVAPANVSFACFERYTNDTLTCAESGPLVRSVGMTHTDTVNVTGYYSEDITYTPTTSTNLTENATDFHNFNLTFSVDGYDTTPLQFYNVTITNSTLSYNETKQGNTRYAPTRRDTAIGEVFYDFSSIDGTNIYFEGIISGASTYYELDASCYPRSPIKIGIYNPSDPSASPKNVYCFDGASFVLLGEISTIPSIGDAFLVNTSSTVTFELLKGYEYEVSAITTNGTLQAGIATVTNTTSSGTEERTYELNLSTIPVIESVDVTNATTTILGTANISDEDSDNQTVDYRWYKNGALYDSGTTTIASPGSYNLDNLTGAEYVSGDLLIFSVRSTDGVSTTDWQNSTAFLAEDTTPPVLENATQPGTVVQNTAGTFTVQAFDNGGIEQVTVSWLDPNSISSGLLSMSLSSGTTYTRSFTFTTTGTYSNVTFTATDGNDYTTTLTGLNFTVTAASGGGGGGGSTIEVPNEVSGTLDAQPVEVYVGPFNSGGELVITNEESAAKTFTVRLVSTDLPDRISFAGSESATLVVEGQGSLSGNKKFVSYTVDREELPEGEYTATFELVDEVGRVVDSVTVTISSRSSPLSGLISGFGTPIFGTITAGTLVALIAFATIAGVLIFRTPRAKATSRRKT